jgi:hypothetical protein
MRRHRVALGPVTVGVSLLSLTACGGSQDAAVESVAADFYAAVAAQDGEGACALLSPTTRSEVEQSSGSPCAEGLLEEDIPEVAAPEAVSVFGAMGQVRYVGDTAYLARYRDGWRVLAVACTPKPVRPDDCRVEGG